MSAFLYLPAAAGTTTTRRVDIGNIASLFAEIEETAVAPGRSGLVTRLLAILLILLFAVGDMVLVSHPDAAALSPIAATPAHASTI